MIQLHIKKWKAQGKGGIALRIRNLGTGYSK